jgi:hypothetical protein
MEVIVEQEKPRPTFVPAETASLETEDQKAARAKGEADGMTEKELEHLRLNALKVMGAEPMTEEEKKAEASKRNLATKPADVPDKDNDEATAQAEEAKKAEAKKKADEDKAKADEAARVAAKKNEKPKRPVLDADAIADAVERGTSAAVRAIEAEKPKPAAPAVLVVDDAEKSLSDADREDLAMIRRIETADPKRAGLGAKFLAYTKKVEDYRRKFETDNPGESFNPNDERHNAFYAANEPDVSAEELAREREAARVDEIVTKRLAERSKPLDEKLAKLEEKEKADQMQARLRELAPAAVKAKAEGILSLIQSVDAEAAKLLMDDKGNFAVTQATLDKLEEHDPWLKAEFEHSGRVVARSIEEIHKINDPDMQRLGYSFDPAKNQVHNHIASVALDAERTLLAGPATARVRDGKEFVTAQQWHALMNGTKGDAAKVREIETRHWTLNPSDLEYLVAGYEAGRIQAKAQELDKIVALRAKRGGKTEQQPTPKTETEVEREARGRRKFPNTASATDRVPDPEAAKKPSESFAEQAIKVAF